MEDGVAPTDSRLRPDQRLMERGLWDEANACKVLLEEKQRAARRYRERQMEDDAAQGTNRTNPSPGRSLFMDSCCSVLLTTVSEAGNLLKPP